MKRLTEEEKKEKVRARVKEWKSRNKEKVRAAGARYREKNKGKISAYRNERKAEFNAKWRSIRLSDPEAWNARRRAARAADPDKFRSAENMSRLSNPAVGQLKTAKKRARIAGVAFDLDRSWFDAKFKAGVCELSGLPFEMKKRSQSLPSIDRKNPFGPYSKENCRLILWCLNRALSNLGDDYFLGVCRAVFIKRGEIPDYEDRMAA